MCPARPTQTRLPVLPRSRSQLRARSQQSEKQGGPDAYETRDLSAKHYVYFWADGIHVQARLEDGASLRRNAVQKVSASMPGKRWPDHGASARMHLATVEEIKIDLSN
jgi:hypothetical protein